MTPSLRIAEVIVEDLTLRNRAYQVLYALGETPESAQLQPGEARMWVDIAGEVEAGDLSSDLRKQIAKRMNSTMLHYVSTGRMEARR